MVNNEGLAATDQLTDTKLGSKLRVGGGNQPSYCAKAS